MTVEIEFVEGFKDVPPDLWAQCFPLPLEGLFWYETLETCGLADQFKFSYALIKRDQDYIGIAPCFLHEVHMSLVVPEALAKVLTGLARVWPRADYQRTLFVGSPCAEEGTIGLIAGLELKDVIEPLAAAVAARARLLKAPMIVFKDCPSVAKEALQVLCGDRKFFRMHSYPGTVMQLPGTSLEDYLAALARTRRHNFKKKLRLSKAKLDLITTIVKRPTDEELVELFALFMQTYNKGKTKFEKLSIEFFRRIRECDPTWFVLQRDRASGKLVTFMLLFELGDRVVNKFIGIDYTLGDKVFLYFRQFEAALDFAYQRGKHEFQSGQTGYRAKLDLGHELIALDNYCRHSNALINAVYARVARDITWATLDSDLIEYFTAHKDKLQQLEDQN